MSNKVTVIIGSQWGDEGKGKLIDLLSKDVDIVGRYNGGSNAGHTIVVDQVKYAFHLVPSGVLYPHISCLIGNGVVIHVPSLFNEFKMLEDRGVKFLDRFFISDRAHLLLDLHKIVDGLSEKNRGKDAIGTTKQGIGPCYSTKMQRTGIRVADLKYFDSFADKVKKLLEDSRKQFGHFEYDLEGELQRYKEYSKKLAPLVVDSVAYLDKAIKSGKKFLVEGANATMLDIDFGTYPYVTSSSPSVGGACIGLGIAPSLIGDVIGIVKAYTTRVGEGPFPTEDNGNEGQQMRKVGHEYGTTTGRPRRCGWLDMVQLRYTQAINQMTHVAVTKLDVLSGFETLKIGVKYTIDGTEIHHMPANVLDLAKVKVEYITLPGWKEDLSKARQYSDLPMAARKYVETIENLLGVPVKWIGVGPGREAIIERKTAKL